ncbi:MAG: 50S ribosomal protein L18 [Planctomycetes bacterium]|nr:50S ribosomal protein L18 [Planctomycetota bacterium]
MSVFRSLANISVQVIDDLKGHTLAAASSLEKELQGAIQGMNKTDAAKKIGEVLAERAKKAGVTQVAFDRGAYKYHGRVKALAEGARSGGLEF